VLFTNWVGSDHGARIANSAAPFAAANVGSDRKNSGFSSYIAETMLGKEHLNTTEEYEQRGDRCLAMDAECSQGNYEHGEEMHGSCLPATSPKSDHG
jgi:hypothetical protein